MADALARAAEICAERGVRLTQQRRQVLELIWSSHRPMGAYALIDRLTADGQRVAPPTVYRALDFLRANGLIHRIERLNAFVGCPEAEEDHAPQFLICDDCGDVAELRERAINSAIAAGAKAASFTGWRASVEVVGICPECAGEGRAS
jgi:Fur family zinc uptake transcriptional regulator